METYFKIWTLIFLFLQLRYGASQITFPKDTTSPTSTVTLVSTTSEATSTDTTDYTDETTDTTEDYDDDTTGTTETGSETTMDFSGSSTLMETTTGAQGSSTSMGPSNYCSCIPQGICPGNVSSSSSTNDGSGNLDPRMQKKTEYSTSTKGNLKSTSPAPTGTSQVVISQTECDTNVDLCCSSGGYQCGIRYPPASGTKNYSKPFAPYGSYPWQGIVYNDGLFWCSGGLIDQIHFVTVASNFVTLKNQLSSITVRMGDYDLRNTNETLPIQEFNVSAMTIHPDFNETSLANNIAILTLSTPVNLGEFPTITTACLPSTPITNSSCWTSGWMNFVSKKYDLERQVNLGLMDNLTCQALLRQTALGPKFNLDSKSFICANAHIGDNACIGEIGAPLVCEDNGQFYITGLISFSCPQSGFPVILVNVANYVSWIQKVTTPGQSSKHVKQSGRGSTKQGLTSTVKSNGKTTTTKPGSISTVKSNGTTTAAKLNAKQTSPEGSTKNQKPTQTTPKISTKQQTSPQTTKKTTKF